MTSGSDLGALNSITRTPFKLVRSREGGASAPWRGRGARIHRIDVEVFVAGVVFDIHDEPGVARPKIAANGPRGLGGHQPGGAEWLAGLLHPDVARFLPGFHESDVLAVGRKLRAGNFGIAEQQFAIDDGSGRPGICDLKLTDFGVSSECDVRFFDCLADLGAGERIQLAAPAFFQARAGGLQFLSAETGMAHEFSAALGQAGGSGAPVPPRHSGQ